jgi:alkylation response protein AidB-like acyl-CoA dehydrogenase
VIDFGLSESEAALQETARRLLAAECPSSLVRETAQRPDGMPHGLWKTMASQGWLGVLVPERLGGTGFGTLGLAVLCEELGRVAAPGPFLASQLAIAALLRAGSAAQRSRWLPGLLHGETVGSLAYLEDSDRHDPEGITLQARRRWNGWVLSGRKLFVPEGQVAQLIVVAARSRPGTGSGGISLFLVERDAAGVHVRPQRALDLTRRTAELALDEVLVPPQALLGREGQGWSLLARLCDLACVGLAADSLGGAHRVLQMAVEYSRVRHQFGRPIGAFQAIKHLAAEMVAEVEPARSLVWWAAWAQDARPRDAARAASMAKASLGEIYSRTARRAVEIHGGLGFTWDCDLHLWYKRAHASELAFGDPSWHRERVARLLGL